MFLDTKFGIHHTLDAERSNLLGSCHWHLAVCTSIGCLIKLIGKVIHVLVAEGMLDAHQIFVRFVDCKNTCEDIVAYNLGQFFQGVHSYTVLVYIAVDG